MRNEETVTLPCHIDGYFDPCRDCPLDYCPYEIDPDHEDHGKEEDVFMQPEPLDDVGDMI